MILSLQTFISKIRLSLVNTVKKNISEITDFCHKKWIKYKKLTLPSFHFVSHFPRKKYDLELIKEKIGMPCIYHPQKKHDDLGMLLRLIEFYAPKNILELGTAFGNTTANICKYSSSNIFTVNALPEQISGNIITGVLSKNEIGSIYRKYNFSNRVNQIYENTLSMNLENYLKHSSIDFVIIDACHDYKYVLNDFFKIQPFLKKDSVVLLHDTHPSCEGHLLSSYRACLKLRKLGFDIKHIPNTWWGIWEKK